MSTQVDIPGYVTGTWAIDTARSAVSFELRQLGISTVRGRFDDFEGTIVTADDPLDSSVSAVFRTVSIDTGNRRRDKHLGTGEFLDVGQYPTMSFTSTGLRADGNNVLVDGDLTIRGVTKQVTLNVAVNGFGVRDDGKPAARFSARTEISHGDYGLIHGPTAAVVGKKIKVTLEIEATKQD